ncbi:MAG: LysR family transcriptional regulator [Nannocystaceae bacterium]|nr:LysR family transcriptional regulator [Nannocystaceae bacterium]
MAEIHRTALFVRVATHLSFSEVARESGVSASSVNRQITALEEHLGACLFRRTTRQLTLTEAGVLYLEYAQRIAADLEEAQRAVARLGESPAGHLRVTAPVGLALLHVSPILPAFFERYPDITVELHLGDGIVDLITERVDVAIRFAWLEDSSLKSRRLAVSRSAVCASPAYLSRRPAIEHPNDLAVHNCLSFRTSPGPTTWRFRKGRKIFETRVDGNLKINSGLGLAAAATDGLGVVMLPSWHVADGLAKGELVRLLPTYALEPDHTPVTAVFAADRLVAPKIRAFVDFLAERFAAQQWSAGDSASR